ncbi:putative transcriptional regulator of viral defense system [Lachnospiraceae bacterium PF1-22]|uniref:type IV toxin-antitoxin system AbiEi family antitoxin domain-containing protein n=1 Tax=Ohessyouella blattaphilus TaxID=2949333 RepID=UPI003E297933
MDNKIKAMFEQHGGVMRTAELKESGIYYNKIQKLLKTGEIEQVRRGYYQYVGEEAFSDIPTITTLFPDGVICMESALDYYGYTDRTPAAWHLAVDSKSTRTRFHIEYPLIKPHYVQTKKFPVGIANGEIDGKRVQVYDRERTICDLLFHRNKVDSEVFNTAIQRYVGDPEKSAARLMQYAKALRVEKKVREVLGVWL